MDGRAGRSVVIWVAVGPSEMILRLMEAKRKRSEKGGLELLFQIAWASACLVVEKIRIMTRISPPRHHQWREVCQKGSVRTIKGLRVTRHNFSEIHPTRPADATKWKL